jgi:hypothetical protein
MVGCDGALLVTILFAGLVYLVTGSQCTLIVFP